MNSDFNMYKGINKALDLCEGRIIGYINADDQYNDHEYFKKIAYYFSKEKFDCIYSGYRVIDIENKREKNIWYNLTTNNFFSKCKFTRERTSEKAYIYKQKYYLHKCYLY